MARCAKGLRSLAEEVQVKATHKVAELGQHYSQCFSELFRPVVPRGSGSVLPPTDTAYPRARSRSPVMAERATNTEFAGDEFCGKRVAKSFAGKIYFGTVVERIKGAVLGDADSNGIRLWQAVWKIEYDDGDVEQQNRLEIIALLRNYRVHLKEDTRHSTNIGINVAVNTQDENDNANEEGDFIIETGMLSTTTNFLDARYNLLQLLTPTATQNRLSYLVELVLDKANKQISNEAIKVRLRKDAAALGAEDMPTDVREISRYLGARTVEEATRQLCGNT